MHLYQANFKPYGLSGDNEEKNERFGCIDSDNGDILSHVKQASEGSFIILENGYIHAKHVFAFPPKNANFSAIVFGFNKNELEKLKPLKYLNGDKCYFKAKIVFELKHNYFKRLHDAIQHLPRHIVLKLNPTVEILSCPQKQRQHYYRSREPPYENLQLDESQTKALHVILNATNEFPILLAGPFGTGKTRLLARAAYDILGKPRSRVLICAHHQASVDTFVEYFGKIIKNEYEPWDKEMVRILPTGSYNSSTFIVIIKNSLCQLGI